MAITAAQVKELRELTGAGMLDCKNALTETNGDVQAAIDWLRERGIAKAQKKSGRIAAEGLAKVVIEGNKAIAVEVNSETDFVAKNEQFLTLLDTVANTILHSQAKVNEEALELATADGHLKDTIVNAVATIGENITLRRFELLEKADDEIFGSYTHQGGRIVSVVVVKGTDDAQVAKNIAMQVASMNPSYISRDYMPKEIVDHEREIQVQLLNNDESLANKPEKVKAGILEGRLSKSLQDMCLVDQEYFLDTNLKVKDFLKENHAEVTQMVKYAVGEGIEKKEDDFAAEVAAMAKN
ncbi:translation elongation factor Ts [Bulleidia extructa W1219]|jgi:translation elongation factor Ts|uniref:Elongation factor Ts n=1 Tax=Bulleidia extructa W1219 TaxID=679192 RepID=D2MNS1_9FIRM|nr:translation elongation factor Ts [Bulleidia extructa]EFC05807.1 translation elongation factor Ts [Bulleidia extructa W1219]